MLNFSFVKPSSIVYKDIVNNKGVIKTVQNFEFKGNGTISSCNYHILSGKGKDKIVIEQTTATTTSITNKIEYIIQDICKAESISTKTHDFYEYYPKVEFKDTLYEIMKVDIDLPELKISWFTRIVSKLESLFKPQLSMT